MGLDTAAALKGVAYFHFLGSRINQTSIEFLIVLNFDKQRK